MSYIQVLSTYDMIDAKLIYTIKSISVFVCGEIEMSFNKSTDVLYGNVTFMSGRNTNFDHIKCGNCEQEIVEGERNHGYKVRDVLETEYHF